MLLPRKRNDSTGLRMGYQICLSYAFYGSHADCERNLAETNFIAESVFNSEKNIKPFMLYFVKKLIKHWFYLRYHFKELYTTYR